MTPDDVDTTQVAVFGNSNSLLRTSYTHRLAAAPGYRLHNFSVGGAPNAALLFGAAQGAGQRFDHIIVEPAVTDAEWIRNGYHTASLMDRNFRHFMHIAGERWDAPITLVVLPTIAAVELGQLDVRSYYGARADEFDVNLIDFYAVYERLFSEPGMRDVFFEDNLHLSPFLFQMLAGLLQDVVRISGRHAGRAESVVAQRAQTDCTIVPPVSLLPHSLRTIERATSLTSQTLARLGVDDLVQIASDTHAVLTSLVVNRQATSAVVEITTEGTDQIVYKDLRLMREQGFSFMLHVAPIMRDMRGVSFRLRVVDPAQVPPGSLEPTSFPDTSRCTNTVELCGAVLLQSQRPTGQKEAAGLPMQQPSPGPTPIVRLSRPGSEPDAARLEADLVARIDCTKHALLDMLTHNVVLPKRNVDRTLAKLVERLRRNDSPGAAYWEFGSAFLQMGCLGAAERISRAALKRKPPGGAANLRRLLAQVEEEKRFRSGLGS